MPDIPDTFFLVGLIYRFFFVFFFFFFFFFFWGGGEEGGGVGGGGVGGKQFRVPRPHWDPEHRG